MPKKKTEADIIWERCLKKILFKKADKYRECPRCRVAFYTKRNGQKYCSSACRISINSKHFKQRHKVKLAQTYCIQCAMVFTPSRPGNTYCSKRCVKKAYIERKVK